MYGRRQPVAPGGLLSTPKATVSKETQDLLKVMMKESQLTNFQMRQLNQKMKSGESLPLHCSPTSSSPPRHGAVGKLSAQNKTSNKSSQKRRGLRTHSTIIAQAQNEQDNETSPHCNRSYNSSIEKERLQDLMAGVDHKKSTCSTAVETSSLEKQSTDIDDHPRSYDEILQEITERREFLEEMESLGKGKEYKHKMLLEVSQRLRELELLDKKNFN